MLLEDKGPCRVRTIAGRDHCRLLSLPACALEHKRRAKQRWSHCLKLLKLLEPETYSGWDPDLADGGHRLPQGPSIGLDSCKAGIYISSLLSADAYTWYLQTMPTKSILSASLLSETLRRSGANCTWSPGLERAYRLRRVNCVKTRSAETSV